MTLCCVLGHFKLQFTLKPIFHCDVTQFALGPGVGLNPQRHNFALRIPTCWYLKTLKFASPPVRNIKFAFPPMQTLNANEWNIGYVGSILFVFGPVFQWNMGFTCS